MIAVSSCSQSEEKPDLEGSIVGTRQLVETRYNDVDETLGNWEQVENGREITFNEDMSYDSEINLSDCGDINASTYLTQNSSEMNILDIIITCDNPDMVFKSKDSYAYGDTNHLILKPIEPACPEAT